ncbi:MAG: 4-(cytidine 5'-diphospho)-2-C-methyl-D-erythritol kinase [Parachlamydiaceae bacterium]
MIQFTLCSPAKVNLFLSVLKKRSDGYHELASLFQAINLSDQLSFKLSSEDLFTCNQDRLPTDGSNLVIKALHLFRKKTDCHFPVHIHLEKNIPHEAGLGGGSSNAATTLFALNKMAGDRYAIEELQTWSAEIGSDVPFFFSSGTAYCTGRGEQVKNLDPIDVHEPLSIVKPAKGLSTPHVFSSLQIDRLPKRDLVSYLNQFYQGEYPFFNDLESAAYIVKPELLNFRDSLLRSGFSKVHMTGSGTAYLCVGQGSPNPSFFHKPITFIRRSNEWY